MNNGAQTVTEKDQLIVSKQRVADRGEVLTPDHIVQAMLELVNTEISRIDSTFLEPACGTGNFLAPILLRKLSIVEKTYGKSQLEYELYAIIAVGSVYGIDILPDNVEDCRERLYAIFATSYKGLFAKKTKPDVLAAAHFILSKNIIWGDALRLTLREKSNEPIIFSEWKPVPRRKIKRRDYTYGDLLADSSLLHPAAISDENTSHKDPKPIKVFRAVPIEEVVNAE